MNILTSIWKAIKAFFSRPGDPPPEPVDTPPFVKDGQISVAVLKAIRNPPPPTAKPRPSKKIHTQIREIEARQCNQQRRTKFSNAEHFKRRQPTTARKLWKANAKLEDED